MKKGKPEFYFRSVLCYSFCMHNIWNRLLDDIKQNWKLLLAIAALLAAMQYFFHGVCPFLLLFGFPCPGCGLTRGCLAVLTLRFDEAMAYNPTSFLWVGLILLWGYFRYVRGRQHPAVTAAAVPVCLLTLLRYVLFLSKYLA